MSRIPCKCLGYRLEKCKCKVLGNGYRCDEPDGVVYLAHTNSICRILDLKNRQQSNIFMRLFESFYDVCAGYNLRYCSMNGFQKHNNHFGNALKDFVILTCFVIANFIVFLTIVIKMLVHIFYVVVMFLQWIRSIQSHRSYRNRPQATRPLRSVWESKFTRTNKSNAATLTSSKTKHLTFKCPITKMYPCEDMFVCTSCCTNMYNSRNSSPPLTRKMFTHNYSPPFNHSR